MRVEIEGSWIGRVLIVGVEVGVCTCMYVWSGCMVECPIVWYTTMRYGTVRYGMTWYEDNVTYMISIRGDTGVSGLVGSGVCVRMSEME